MNTTGSHRNGNSHSASIQCDSPEQLTLPSNTTSAPFPLLPHYQHSHNNDDDNGGEYDPLLDEKSCSSGGQNQRRQRDHPAPVLHRPHDWVSDCWTRLRTYELSSPSSKALLIGWKRALLWSLIVLGITLVLGLVGLRAGLLDAFPPFTCRVTNDNAAQLVYSFDPDQYGRLFFHLDKDMVGDIYVRQNDSPNDGDDGKVKIYVRLRASNTNILLATTLNAIPHPEDSSIEANVYLELYGRERERALRWGCVETDVSILFPWNMTRFESLQIQHRNKGNVDVWFGQYGGNHTSHGVRTAVESVLRSSTSKNNHMSYNAGDASFPAPEAPRVVMDQLDIKTKNGDVSLIDAMVANTLKVISEQGSIVGQVTANKRIEIESKLHTFLALKSNSTSDLELRVSAETVAQVSMESPYYGHMSLTTWASFFRPELFFSPEYTFVQQTRTMQTLTGYFSYPDANGTKPSGPLPRVRIGGERASFTLGR